MSKEYEIETKIEQQQCLLLKMLFLLGYNLQIYLMQEGGGIDIWWKWIFLGGGGISKFLYGGRGLPPLFPVEKGLMSTLVWDFFLFQGNLYTMLVILDIKFRVANIKWNLCQNTVKFQNMTSLVGKICTNIQTSADIIF